MLNQESQTPLELNQGQLDEHRIRRLALICRVLRQSRQYLLVKAILEPLTLA